MRQTHRADFDALFSTASATRSTPTAPQPWPTLIDGVKKILVFYSPSHPSDASRLFTLLDLLDASVKSKAKSTSILAPLYEASELITPSAWAILFGKFVGLLASTLQTPLALAPRAPSPTPSSKSSSSSPRPPAPPPPSASGLSPIITALLFYTEARSWVPVTPNNPGSTSPPPPPIVNLSSIAHSLLAAAMASSTTPLSLSSPPLYPSLRSALNSEEVPQKIISSTYTLSLRPMLLAVPGSHLAFATSILSIELLVPKLPPQLRAPLANPALFGAILSSLASPSLPPPPTSAVSSSPTNPSTSSSASASVVSPQDEQEPFARHMPADTAIFVLGNILSVYGDGTTFTQPAIVASLAYVLDALSDLVPRASLLDALEQLRDSKDPAIVPHLPASDDDDEGYDSEDDEWGGSTLEEELSSPKDESGNVVMSSVVSLQLAKQLSPLFMPSLLLKLFQSLLPSESRGDAPPVPTPPNSSPDSSPILDEGPGRVCSLYSRFYVGLRRNPLSASSSDDVFSLRLSYDHPMLRRLWAAVLNSKVFDHFRATGRLTQRAAGILQVFAAGYARLLATLYDEDFFVKAEPFDLATVQTMVSSLRTLTYRLYFSGGSTSRFSLMQSSGAASGAKLAVATFGPGARPQLASTARVLRTTLSKLLVQLRDRNARQEFMPAEAWFAPELARAPSQQIMNDIALYTPILESIPFVMPFETRVAILQSFMDEEKSQVGRGDRPFAAPASSSIRRSHIFEDGYSALAHLGPSLKGRLRVSFINADGLPEAGIDGGGVFKEFLTELAKIAFDPRLGLFKEAHSNRLYPNPVSGAVVPDHVSKFEFLGRILGKAMYEGVLVDLPFAPFFLRKLLGKTTYMNELPSLDPETYRNLLFLRSYEGDVSDLALTFSITQDQLGEMVEIPLIPGGENIPVTAKNRYEYILRVANWHLNSAIQVQSAAFLRGFTDMVPQEWLRMFTVDELDVLISGASNPLDLHDFKYHVVYSNGYSASHPTIQAFWKVVEGFDAEQKAALLKFVTSVPRPPLLGFKDLVPKFAISKVADTDRLPTAATCVNLLKLPDYGNEELLRQKLLYAIKAGAGFELS